MWYLQLDSEVQWLTPQLGFIPSHFSTRTLIDSDLLTLRFANTCLIFYSLPPSLTVLKNNKVKLKAALRKSLNTHSFYSVDAFFMCKDNL